MLSTQFTTTNYLVMLPHPDATPQFLKKFTLFINNYKHSFCAFSQLAIFEWGGGGVGGGEYAKGEWGRDSN